MIKVPSTRGEEARGFMNGIGRAAEGAGAIATIVHGTTVGTNALLERKVARTGIITTAGFRDVLEMRRRDRPQTWPARRLRTRGAARPAAGGRRAGAGRRRDPHRGQPDQVEAAARELLARGCEAVCVFFVNAYANPVNEARAVARVREIWPNGHVTAATEVLPEIREFERCSTATLNAALQPVVGSYLTRLQQDLRGHGFDGELLVVQSNGGVMSRETACDVPVRTALSGPAAGVIACAAIARAAGLPDVVTGDMGGTSFDVAGGWRRGLAGGADRDRVRHGGARADDTDRDHRRGRRFDRQRGCRRPAAGRSGIGRQQSRRPAMAGATHGPPSPTPMCCSAASRPTGRWAADCWRGWTPNARARPSTSTWAGRWA